MQPGKIVLLSLLQSDNSYKVRPALILKTLPKYNDFLVCGISTQVHQYLPDYDEILYQQHSFFPGTGLRQTSLIRLLYLAVTPSEKVAGSIGKIPEQLLTDLLQRLGTFINT